MPKYNFVCECGHSVKKYTPREKKALPCKKCGGQMERELPILNGPADKKEVIDPVLNLKKSDDHDKIIKARKAKYYWNIEVPRLVQSGVYGIDTMIEKGWVWLDDNGNMHIHNKPPHER